MPMHQLTPSLQNFADKHQSEKLIFCPCGRLGPNHLHQLLIFWHLGCCSNHMIREGLPKTVRPHIWNSYSCLAKSLCVFGPSCSHGDKGNVLGSAEFCHPMSLYRHHQPKKGDKPKWSQRFCVFLPSVLLSYLPSLCLYSSLTHLSLLHPGALAAGRAGAEAVGLWEASSREPAGHDQRQQVDLWAKVNIFFFGCYFSLIYKGLISKPTFLGHVMISPQSRLEKVNVLTLTTIL